MRNSIYTRAQIDALLSGKGLGILGRFDTVDEIKDPVELGHYYIGTETPYDVYTYIGGVWINAGKLEGPAGPRGPSGVYVGSGEMPEDANVQIDPSGDPTDTGGLMLTSTYDPQGKGTDIFKALEDGLASRAPSGFGLGSVIPYLAKSADGVDYNADTVLESCFFRAAGNMPTTGWWYGLCISYSDTEKTQYAFSVRVASNVLHGTVCKRVMKEGVWEPWEYINPPMVLGVEYRTTERYLNKPVYVKLVDCGNLLGSGGIKDIASGDSSIPSDGRGIRCYGVWSYDGSSTIPFESSETDRLQVGILGNKIRIYCGKDFSTHTAKVAVCYYKTTD